MITINDFGVKVQKATLSNNTRVLLFQKKGMPIYTEVRFASGSRFDPVGKEGLAHFVEHMIVSGSVGFPSKDKLATYIEQYGGIFGASTSSDEMTAYVEVAGKEDFSKSVLLLKEMLTESSFESKMIEMEREVILEERAGKITNPAKHIFDLYYESFFQGTERGKSNLGSEESLKAITKEDLNNYYNDMLVSGRAVIGVCGDIDLEQVVDELEKGLPLRVSDKYKVGESLPVVRDKKILIHNYPNQTQIQLLIGFRTCNINNPDIFALKILAIIFGGGRASALSKRLRSENGLVYAIQVSTINLSDSGVWVVKTSTSKDKLQQVLNIISEEFSRIALGNITEDELKFAKAKIIKSSRRNMQTSASWVKEHISKELSGNSTSFPDYLNSIDLVTKKDLLRVGKKYFKKDSWYLAMCGNIDEGSVTVNF